MEVLLIWIVVSFPSGRLSNRKEKAIVIAGAAAVALLWLPGMMFSPQIPLRGPFASCVPECPANLFFVADRPTLAAAFLAAFRVAALIVLAATALYLFSRLRQATPFAGVIGARERWHIWAETAKREAESAWNVASSST